MKIIKFLMAFILSIGATLPVFAANNLTANTTADYKVVNAKYVLLDFDNCYSNSGACDNSSMHDHSTYQVNSTSMTIVKPRPDTENNAKLVNTIIGVRLYTADKPIICQPYDKGSNVKPTIDNINLAVTIDETGIPSCNISY